VDVIDKEKRRAYQAAFKEKNPAYAKAYCAAHREEKRVYDEAYREAHRGEIQAYNAAHKKEQRAWHRSQNAAIRLAAINHYGGKCACCGETNLEFLAIDHINNDGAEHRRQVGKMIYRWLRANNYPGGFQVLCHNCNMAKGFYGYCPHQGKGAPVGAEPIETSTWQNPLQPALPGLSYFTERSR
jgi:hypothetical protein